MRNQTILVVSQDKALSWQLYNNLGKTAHIRLANEPQGSKADATALQIKADLMVIDLETPGLEQSWLAMQLQGHREPKDIPMVVVSERLSRTEREKATRMTGHLFICKTTDAYRLSECVRDRLAN